jgi:hypothetical protein
MTQTTPIEERLRAAANDLNNDASYLRTLCREAAAEIEELQDALMAESDNNAVLANG